MIYLYVKEHKITGLKYFGATKNDPYTYCGSGTRWLNHCKVHGFLIETTHVFPFEDENAGSEFALTFSASHNIVKSEEWANLMPEDGLIRRVSYERSQETCKKLSDLAQKRCNGKSPFEGKKHTNESKIKISASKKVAYLKNGNPFYGKQHTPEAKKKISQAAIGRVKSSETIKKLSEALKGRVISVDQKGKMKTYAQNRKWIVNSDGGIAHCVSANDPRLLSGHWRYGKKWLQT